MPRFTVHAYQEMFVHQVVEAQTAREAAEKFKAMVAAREEIAWEIGDEDLEIMDVRDENDEEVDFE